MAARREPLGRLAQLFQRGHYDCPRAGCDGSVRRRSPWSHDARRTAHATFCCSACRYEEELVVTHYSELDELGLHAQHPTLTGRARCPRCGEPMAPRALLGADVGGLRFLCQRCGGARDVVLLPEDRRRLARAEGAILIVDRDVPRALELQRPLVEQGAAVEIAADERAALALLDERPFDVLVVADDGSLNTDLVAAHARRGRRPPRHLFLLAPQGSVEEPEPLPARRLPLPCDPALLSWFVAYAEALPASVAG